MHRRRTLPPLLSACLALGLGLARAAAAADAVPGAAPEPAVVAPAPEGRGELARFEAFLDSHPNVEARLRENVGLLTNEAFLRNHPYIAQFLNRHPGLAADLAAHPRWFIHRELARVVGEPLSREQLAEFDHYLDQHPALEHALATHPGLLRRQEFLGRNPELKELVRRRTAGPRR